MVSIYFLRRNYECRSFVFLSLWHATTQQLISKKVLEAANQMKKNREKFLLLPLVTVEPEQTRVGVRLAYFFQK